MLRHYKINLWLAALCVTFSIVSCKKKEETSEQGAREPVRIETISVSNNTVTSGRVYSGVTEETSGTVLSFTVPGPIKTLIVEEGQNVSKGQLIGTLDDATLQSNVQIAKAALATAQDTYDRMKMLHDANSIPEIKWVEVSNALKAAKSSYDIAVNALSDTKLYAPVSGVISRKLSDIGQMAGPGVPVVEISRISPLKATISVSENEIANFEKGAHALISVDALKGAVIEGILTEKGVTADPLSRTYSVKFQFENPDGKFLPGMLCNVSLKGEEDKEAIVLPMNCILLDSNNKTFVWLDNKGKAEKRIVTLGEYLSDGVIIESGLSVGDKVIVSGQQKVSEGMNVVSVNQ